MKALFKIPKETKPKAESLPPEIIFERAKEFIKDKKRVTVGRLQSEFNLDFACAYQLYEKLGLKKPHIE